MPPRKTPARRKKLSSATTPTPTPTPTPTLVDDDHKSPKQEVETGAGLAGAPKVETEEMSGQVEVPDPNSAKIDGDSTTYVSVSVSPESMNKAEVVLGNSAVSDVNGTSNENGEPELGGGKVAEDLRVGSEDEEPEEEEPEEVKQGSDIDSSQFETVAAVKGDNEEEKQENAEVILPEDSVQAVVTTKTSSENNIAALILEDYEEIDDVSEEDDDADNEGDDEDPSEDPVSDHKKDNKDIEIYVGGLDKNTVEDDLVNLFQQFGELKSTRIMRNSNTNKSKGFAFVRFVSSDHAKLALSKLKDGVEVRGKIVKISQSQDNHTLYLGNIDKSWQKEEVLQQLNEYGIEHIETIRIPENPKIEGKNKGFAFLEFNTHSDAVTAFQRLKKPDAVFGRDISAKVAFAQTPMPQNDEDLLQAKRVFLEGLGKDWNEEKVKEICKKYGEIVKVDLCQNPRAKHKDFGFITFESNENALACVEGINNADFGEEVKIKAEIAKPQSKRKPQKQGFRGGFKVEPSTTSNKEGRSRIISKEISEPKSIKAKGQVKRNKKDTTFNKPELLKNKGKKVVINNGESSKKAELIEVKGDSNSNKKRKPSSNQNPRHGDQGTSTKKPKFGGEGQNSNSASKAGSHKRKGREDGGGNRNVHNKKPFKKQKGNVRGRERDNNFRNNPNNDNNNNNNRIRRGQLHDDYRTSTRYMDSYAPPIYVASDSSYRVGPDSLSARRFKEMEPHAGYIEAAARPYSGYVQPVVRTHNPHQTVYLSPGQSQSQSQLHSRYQSHRGYIETTVVPHHEVQVQPYRTYQQIARDPYDSGISRSVRHDGRGSGLVTYAAGGPPVSSSQVRNHTSYYQGGGSYSGGYTSQRTYY